MIRCVALLALLALPARAADKWVGEISSSGASTTNVSTSTPFPINPGARYSIQCDQNVNVAFGALGTIPVATTAQSGMFYLALQPVIYDVCTFASSVVWAIIPVTAGSAKCQVFRVPMTQWSCS
jgi:hypothetical protein